MNLTTHFLFASLIWGSIGLGYFIYGKKQVAIPPLVGGLLMIGCSYFIGSAFWMSVACVGVLIAIHLLLKMF